MAYPLQAIYDANGDHVGFLDGPFVLDRNRHVIAELRAGVVVCLSGRVPGTYNAECFLDRTSKVVAVARRTLPVPRFPLGMKAVAASVRSRVRQRARGWSEMTWRQYIAL